MNIAVFAAYPYGSDEGGSEAYKPAVGVVLGGACLTAGLALGIAADAAAGAFVDDGYKQSTSFCWGVKRATTFPEASSMWVTSRGAERRPRLAKAV